MKHTNIAYCQSVDIHLPEFTVYQHLHYACLLRLGCKLSTAESEKQCRLAAAAVGIDSVLDRCVKPGCMHECMCMCGMHACCVSEYEFT